MFNNPYFINQARQNMTAENIKSASERMASMSDSELQNMAKLAGFNFSPELLKTSANMMKNMDPQELERMKNLAGSFNPSAAPFNGSNPYVNASTPSYKGSTPSDSNRVFTNSNTTANTTSTSSFPKIETLKKKGNDLFSQGKYEEAGTVYFESILDIEEIRSGEGWENGGKGIRWEELKTLEIACRLNYAISKSKVGEWDVVLTQGKEVLKLGENGKARFRVGQALHYLGKNDSALSYLEKARELLPNDPTGKVVYFRHF
jgi:tetratricopeptide (TPR) repeat protein